MRGAPVSLVGIPNTITGNKSFTGITTISNQLIVTGFTGSVVTLKLSAAAGQTGNLLELYNTSAVLVAHFDQAGNFVSTGAASYSSTSVSQGATGVGFTVQAHTANSSDIQQWLNSSGGVLLGITSTGNIYGGSGLTVGGNLVVSGATGMQIRGDNSAVDPGVPWLRSDGSSLFINPHGTGSVNIATDNAQQTTLGGIVAVKGHTVLNYGGAASVTSQDVVAYVNTGSAGATGGYVSLTSGGPSGTDGAYIEYTPPSAGNTANRLHITGAATATLAELDIKATMATFSGTLQFPSTAAFAPAAGFGGGLRMSFVGVPTGDGTSGTYGFGIAPSTLWAMTGGGQFAVYTSNAGSPVPILNLNQGTLSLYAGGPSTIASGTGLFQIRADNSTVDPGMPWLRSDGSNVVLNPSGTGSMFLCWDKSNGLNVGGTLLLSGSASFLSTLGVTGQVTAQAAILGHGSYQVVEGGSSSPTHAEHYGPAGSNSTAASTAWAVGFTFSRAYGSAPAAAGSCQTTAGNHGVASGASSISTTAATIYFYNSDSGTQTLSNASILAFG